MKINAEIVASAARHVTKLMNNELPAEYCYHNLSHTENVVDTVTEISGAMRLSEHGRQILLVAAWFHDLGYIVQIKDHEKTAADMAEEFLQQKNVDADDIAYVKACIMATRYPQNPLTVPERIICDADLIHLGQNDYLEKMEMIRQEWELTKGEKYTDQQWYMLNIDFLNNHSFHTDYCIENYNERKEKNIRTIKKIMKKKAAKQEKGLIIKPEEKGSKELPSRGVETLFRTASRNHMQLSGMADSKAHILLSINSIIISVIISVLMRKIEESPHLAIPTIILLTVCLATIVFAVLTTKPKVSKGIFTRDQVKNHEVNLMFFGNFHNMDIETYSWGVKEIMNDKDYLYSSMTKDIYFLGKVLAVKYRYLNIGYKIFMFGMIASVVAFGVSMMVH